MGTPNRLSQTPSEHCLVAEQQVLGAAMFDRECVELVVARCRPRYFYFHAHRDVFYAI